MAWPSGPVSVTDLDQTTDSPSSARGQLYALAVAVNDIIASQPGVFLFSSSSYTLTISGGIIAESTWKSIGPTGSGADVIWASMDNIPTTARGLILRGRINGISSGMATFTAQINVRKTGIGLGTGENTMLAFVDLRATAATETIIGTSGGTFVDCDSLRRIDANWYQTGSTTKDASITLLGYYR